MCSHSPPQKQTRKPARVISAISLSQSLAPRPKLMTRVTLLNRKYNYWLFMECYICLDMITPKLKKKPGCGKHRPRYWQASGWVKFRYEKNNVIEKIHPLTHQRIWTRLSRLVACTSNPA